MLVAVVNNSLNIEVRAMNGKYRIEIGWDILDRLGLAMVEHDIGKKVMVVTNKTVNELYGSIVKRSLSEAGLKAIFVEIPEGERYKTFETAQRLYDALITNYFDRKSSVLTLGGGVVEDIGGFVAASYMRGINLFHAPTTLLAQIDSSIGGKSAINHPLGKNLIGIFYPPKLVWSDLKTLETLPGKQLSSGMAEVVKSAVIGDESLFHYIMKNLNQIKSLEKNCLLKIIFDTCAIKARIVEADERESGLRMILNYGHTIGHALEAITEYELYTHGEAISIGMMVEAKISNMLGHFNSEDLIAQEELLKAIGLPTRLAREIDPKEIARKLFLDKKVRDGRVTFVLPERIGKAFITNEVSMEIVVKALEGLRN
jgi:3-dehydroquinate synthase